MKQGDQILLTKNESEIKHLILSIKKNKKQEQILCCKSGEVCKVLKINKHNDGIYLHNLNRNIKFRVNQNFLKMHEFNFEIIKNGGTNE